MPRHNSGKGREKCYLEREEWWVMGISLSVWVDLSVKEKEKEKESYMCVCMCVSERKGRMN